MIFNNCSLHIEGKMKTTICRLTPAEWKRKPFTEVGDGEYKIIMKTRIAIDLINHTSLSCSSLCFPATSIASIYSSSFCRADTIASLARSAHNSAKHSLKLLSISLPPHNLYLCYF